MKQFILASAALLALTGCATLRWSRDADAEPDQFWVWSTGDAAASTQSARARPPSPVLPESLPNTVYYADLGPDEIDVSSYPARQRENYALFRRECSRCHTAARAVNSPVESRLYWRFHLTRMSLHSRFRSEGAIPPRTREAILDFLEYDARVRKIQDKKRFDARTEELKRRFEPILEKMLDRMRQDAEPEADTLSAPR